MQKSQILFILGLLLAILVTIFALTNANPVVLNLFLLKFEASQALIIFSSAALGAIIVISLGIVKHFKLTRKVTDLQKKCEELQKVNDDLKQDLDNITENDQKSIKPDEKKDEPPLQDI